MKNLIISISVCLLLCQCKHEEYVPDCVCSDVKVIKEFGTQEGQLLFPSIRNPQATYNIISQNNFADGFSSRYVLCTDSALLKQIIEKKIKDSSQVVMTGVGVAGGRIATGNCNIFVQRTPIYPDPQTYEFPITIRVKTIDKK
jgi:hypothetical protein